AAAERIPADEVARQGNAERRGHGGTAAHGNGTRAGTDSRLGGGHAVGVDGDARHDGRDPDQGAGAGGDVAVLDASTGRGVDDILGDGRAAAHRDGVAAADGDRHRGGGGDGLDGGVGHGGNGRAVIDRGAVDVHDVSRDVVVDGIE